MSKQFDIQQRVIDTTRAFEKKHFSPKVDEGVDSSNLTTTQQAIIKVMLKEDFGCNQGKVRRLMAAVTGIDESLLRGGKREAPLPDAVRFLAVTNKHDETRVCLGFRDGDGDLILSISSQNRDEDEYGLDEDDRPATNVEIEEWFTDLLKD